MMKAAKNIHAEAEVEKRLLQAKDALQRASDRVTRETQRVRRTSTVASQAQDKAKWMGMKAKVQRLQYLSATRWAMMAKTEMRHQWNLAIVSEKKARSRAFTGAQQQAEAATVKAKMQDLSFKAKIAVLKAAHSQAAKARRTMKARVISLTGRVKSTEETFMSA